ncbi:MAG: hypothetical protein HY298_20875 [Verrucomicrobia bacterium]|nr:hypothetical protein [Verrucomicrobiota bacterium]
MTAPAKSSGLLPLVTKLKACPTLDDSFSQKLLIETWGCLKRTDLEHGDELTPSIMAGLVLFDEEHFVRLLNEAEHSQLAALAKTALERFKEKSNPPNKLGKTIAAALKEKI